MPQKMWKDSIPAFISWPIQNINTLSKSNLKYLYVFGGFFGG